MQAKRQGKTIKITGQIDHVINDIYDFNDDTFFDKHAFKDFRFLAKNKKAKAFRIQGVKSEKISGKLEIKNGNIKNKGFDFENSE